MKEKYVKIIKQAHAFKGYTSSYNIEISFNLELQPKESESAIKNKLNKLLSELRGFKFVKTLVLVLKKIESKDKTEYYNFLHFYSQKQLLMK